MSSLSEAVTSLRLAADGPDAAAMRRALSILKQAAASRPDAGIDALVSRIEAAVRQQCFETIQEQIEELTLCCKQARNR